jgi:hypothetical protein
MADRRIPDPTFWAAPWRAAIDRLPLSPGGVMKAEEVLQTEAHGQRGEDTALLHMLSTAERIGLHDELSDRAFETKTMGVDHLPQAIDLVSGSAELAELEAQLAAALASKPAPASRRQRRPLIDAEITRAEKAGKIVAAASMSPDGTLSLTFQRPSNGGGAINPETPEDLRKLL